MGIAGPVENNTCKLTNVENWPTIVGEELAAAFGMERFKLMNDFEAAGYGVLELKDGDVVNINDARAVEGRPKAVIGAGTGIGECILTAHNGEYVVWPGEGGHCDFFPHDDLEVEYSHYILEQVKPDSDYKHFLPIENITIELAIGGIVLPHLYYFHRQKYPELLNPDFDRAFEASFVSKDDDGRGRMLFENGLTGRDALCQKGTELFMKILGYEAGNMAAKTLCYGGIYLMGGTVQTNLEGILASSTLKTALYKKPLHITKILQQVPVFLVKPGPEVGLLGAQHYARKLIH